MYKIVTKFIADELFKKPLENADYFKTWNKMFSSLPNNVILFFFVSELIKSWF